LIAAAKFLVAETKILFFVLNFVAVTKPFFSVLQPVSIQALKIWKIWRIPDPLVLALSLSVKL